MVQREGQESLSAFFHLFGTGNISLSLSLVYFPHLFIYKAVSPLRTYATEAEDDNI